MIDLLTEQEEAVAITDWILRQTDLNKLGLGYFGASTGAAATLVAAAERPAQCGPWFPGRQTGSCWRGFRGVVAPTLFIVGGEDLVVLGLNYSAIKKLPARIEHKLEIIDSATHLFEEPGTLDQVSALARNWFQKHLNSAQS